MEAFTREFFRVIKFALRGDPSRYKELLELFIEMMAGRLGQDEFSDAVEQMFQNDRPEIIFFINSFLPEEYRTPLFSPVVNRAVDLILKVRERSRDGGGGDGNEAGSLRESFLDLLRTFNGGMKTYDDFRSEVLALFRDHQDLQRDLEDLFPSSGGDQPPSDGGEGGSDSDNGEQPSVLPA